VEMIDSDPFLSLPADTTQYVLLGPRLWLERLKWRFMGYDLEYSDSVNFPVSGGRHNVTSRVHINIRVTDSVQVVILTFREYSGFWRWVEIHVEMIDFWPVSEPSGRYYPICPTGA